MKHYFKLIILCLGISTIGFSQTRTIDSVKRPKPIIRKPIIFHAGMGLVKSIDDLDKPILTHPGTKVNISFYRGLVAKALDNEGNHSISVGIHLGANYIKNNRDYNTSGFSMYNFVGQTSSPTIVARGSGSPKAQGFIFEAGPQAEIQIGNFLISPIITAGYQSYKQKSMEVKQSISIDSSIKEFTLYSQAENNNKGLVITPKLRLAYKFGKIGIWIEGNYSFGSQINTISTINSPVGNANANGQYNISQINIPNSMIQEQNQSIKNIGIMVGLQLRKPPPPKRKPPKPILLPIEWPK